jgi:hypothetical protein
MKEKSKEPVIVKIQEGDEEVELWGCKFIRRKTKSGRYEYFPLPKGEGK